jgi:hypothetical protein
VNRTLDIAIVKQTATHELANLALSEVSALYVWWLFVSSGGTDAEFTEHLSLLDTYTRALVALTA